MLPAHYQKDKPNYFCRFTFGQFFTLLVLEIFTLFFVFYLGARYGKEFLGITTQNSAKKTEGLPEITSTDLTTVTTTKDPEMKALAKEILAAAPSPNLKQRVSEMLEESAEKKGAEQRPWTTAKPKEEPKPPVAQPEPPVIKTAPADAKFSIQVGSFPNADEAHHIVGQWKAKGYPSYLVSADIPGKGRWYRVRLGSFPTKEEAQVFLEEFKKKENVEAFVAGNH